MVPKSFLEFLPNDRIVKCRNWTRKQWTAQFPHLTAMSGGRIASCNQTLGPLFKNASPFTDQGVTARSVLWGVLVKITDHPLPSLLFDAAAPTTIRSNIQRER